MSAGETLHYVERGAAGDPDGLLILHHGRGSDELDMMILADALDERRRLHVCSVRAPLRLPGSPGYHWYLVPRVGYPDRATFDAALAALAQVHDEIWARTGFDASRTVLGGFSMGAVMSYALALTATRPAPAGILAFSGFVPTVEGWRPSLADRRSTAVFIAHGTRDPVIDFRFALQARELLAAGGLPVDFHEHEMGHQIASADVAAGAAWLDGVLPSP